MSLAEYQQRLLGALSRGTAASVDAADAINTADPAATSVAAEIVERAQADLSSVCTIVCSLLESDHRLTDEVRIQLLRHDRPLSIQAWGMIFAARLSSDPDPWISWAAQLDAGSLAEESRRVDKRPGPLGVMPAVMLIPAAGDPRPA